MGGGLLRRARTRFHVEWQKSVKPVLFAGWANLRLARRRSGTPHGLSAPLVVSLTSYPKRFSYLGSTLKCLLSQTVAADRIILWIAHDDRAALDEQLLGLVDAGLEIRFCEDLLSYKKIIPTLREMPGAVIVTADDDVYYWPTWLEELVRAHTEDRRTVMCHRANSVRLGESGQPAPYLDWSLDTRSNGTSSLVFPTGVGGVLYPPGVFYSDVLREDLFRELCPSGDDIWLYWMVRLNRGRSRKIGKRRVFTEWPGFRVGGLAQYNYLQGGNDRQIQAMVGAYGFPHV